MIALDLRSAPPRPPREAFLGVTFLPRTIDNLRALLPGGDTGAYRMTGFSLRLFEMFGTDEARALAAVRDAADDLTAARAIVGDASADRIATLNATLESIEPFVMFPERARVVFPFAVDRPDPRLRPRSHSRGRPPLVPRPLTTTRGTRPAEMSDVATTIA